MMGVKYSKVTLSLEFQQKDLEIEFWKTLNRVFCISKKNTALRNKMNRKSIFENNHTYDWEIILNNFCGRRRGRGLRGFGSFRMASRRLSAKVRGDLSKTLLAVGPANYVTYDHFSFVTATEI